MAEVFLAKATGPGGFEKTLVVKRILPHLAERESFLEMFFAEARIAAQLQHPNIVQIFDFGEEDGAHFIAMEYVEGYNLRLLSRWAKANGGFSPALVAKVGALACEGLAYAHDFTHPETGAPMGLVHRDVSADNIMLSRHGAVKLLDFGIARVEGEEQGTGAGVMKGKIAYMPVEQVSGEPIDRRADVYALGVVLYLMLTGHRPYERDNDVALITAILSEEPTPLQAHRPDVPDELAAIIGRCLARERDERFDDCRQLQQLLEDFIARRGEVVGTARIAQVVATARAAGLGTAETGRVGASTSGSGSGSRSRATPKPTAGHPGTPAPAPLPRPSPGEAPHLAGTVPALPGPRSPVPALHLAGTVPGTPGPLLLEWQKTRPFLPTPEVLEKLRAEAPRALEVEDADDDGLGPEPPTSPGAAPLLFYPAETSTPKGDDFDAEPPTSPGAVSLLVRPAEEHQGGAFDAEPPTSPGGVLRPAEASAPPPPTAVEKRATGSFPAASAAPPPDVFAPPPPTAAEKRATGSFPAASAAPPPDVFAPPPPTAAEKRATGGFPAASAAPPPGLFAPPPPTAVEKRATGSFPAASAAPPPELFAPPPPTTASAAPPPELFAPPPPTAVEKRATGSFPAASAAPPPELFAPPPPTAAEKRATGSFPPAAAPPPASAALPPESVPAAAATHPTGSVPAPHGPTAPAARPAETVGRASSELQPGSRATAASASPMTGAAAPPPQAASTEVPVLVGTVDDFFALPAAPPAPASAPRASSPSGVTRAADAARPPSGVVQAVTLAPSSPSGVTGAPTPVPSLVPAPAPSSPSGLTRAPGATSPPSGAFPRASAPVLTPSAPPPADAPPPAPSAPFRSSSSGSFKPERQKASVPGFADARLLAHHPHAPAPAAVLGALRSAAAEDRSRLLLRKFPPVAARLMELSADFAPGLEAACAALLDAALLAEEHAVVARLVQRANTSPTKGGRFGAWLRAELASPWRLLTLAERLRRGLPVDTASLQAWLAGLGPEATPALFALVDSLEPGPAQDVVGRALGTVLAADPSPVLARLDETPPRNPAAMAFVLEASGAADRAKVFARLLARRDVPLTLQLMSGRARAKGPDALVPLEAALGNRAPEVRLHALALLAEEDSPAVAKLLLAHVQAPTFEKRPDAERAAFWAALASSRDGQALAVMAAVFDEKTTLLTRKKAVTTRLPLVEGLARSHTDDARALLERVAQDKAQPDEVAGAAREALTRRAAPPTAERLSPEQRARLRRVVTLDLCALVRAATVTDAGAGYLDAALARFREELRLVVAHDGRYALAVDVAGVGVNGAPLPLAWGGVDVAPQVARAFAAHDVRSFEVDGPVPVGELKACLLQLCDADGTPERAPHVRVTTASGRALEALPPPGRVADPGIGAAQAYRAAVDFLLAQRAGLSQGRLPTVEAAGGLLQAWVAAYATHATGLLSVLPSAPGDAGFAVHAVNTACVGMAFAGDLQLGRATLREVAQLALFWTLAEAGLPPERRTAPGVAAPDDVRLRLSTLFLSQPRRTRHATAAAVAAIDAGLDAPKTPGRGAGVVASVVALAEAWDALAVTAGLGHAAALTRLERDVAHRFAPDLLGLFVRWASAQLAANG